MASRTIDLSPDGLLLEISSEELEGSVFVIGQRLDVDVPLLVANKNKSSHIAYKAEVVRVESRTGSVLVGCKALRARLRRTIALEMPSYAM